MVTGKNSFKMIERRLPCSEHALPKTLTGRSGAGLFLQIHLFVYNRHRYVAEPSLVYQLLQLHPHIVSLSALHGDGHKRLFVLQARAGLSLNSSTFRISLS